MSYLDRIAACNRYDLSGFVPFSIDGATYGWLRPAFAERLRRWPEVFVVGGDEVALNPELTGYAERSAAVAGVTAALRDEGVIGGWRDERYPVALARNEPAAFEIERAAVPHFGLRAWGVHVNGLVRSGDEVLVWIARRAADKETFPDMLDHLAAGGLPVGITPLENVVKECAEEAGVPAELARNAMFVCELDYCCETGSGLKPDTILVFDLWLPDDFVPYNTDGEVASFERWTLDKVARVVAATERFKPNCNLVLIDLLRRHGRLGVDAAAEAEIITKLYQPTICIGSGSQFLRKRQPADTKTGSS